MKAEDPESVIVGGSIYGIQFSYIEDMMGTYLGDGMDAFSVQPTHYGSSDFYLEYYFQSYLSRLGRNLKAYGAGDLNVWLTSIWNSRAVRRSNSGGGSSWNHFGDRNAASKFCRMALASTPYDFCEGVYIHSLTDGVVSQRSYVNALIDPDGSPTAGYAAFNTVARMIGHKRFVNNLPIEVSNKSGRGNNYAPFAHLYSNDNGKLLAAWTRAGYFTYNFKTDAEQLILTDLMGNESTVKTWNGLLSLRLSNEPTFIKGFSEIEIGPPIFSLTGPESSPAGLPVEMELTLAEGFPNEGFELELPSGWQSEWTSTTDLKLALPERVSLGNHSVTLKPKNFPGMSSSTNVSLHESTVLKLSAAEDGTLKVTVTNPLPIVRKANVQVSLYAPEVSKELLSEEFTVPAEDSIVKLFQAAAEHPEGYSQARIMARLNTGRGSGKREVFYLGNTPCYEMSKVDLDGSLVEWQGLRPALLDQKYQYNEERSPDRKSAEDLSARFWTGWDSEQFYVAVEVADETHRNPYSGNYLCYGDSIRFTVAGEQLASDFGVAKLGSGMINTHEFYPSGNNGPDDLKAKIVRTGTKTFYEVAVTWPRLRVPYEHRDRLRFSLLLIDADIRKVEGVMEWCNWPGWSSSMRAEHHNPMIWLKGNQQP